MKRSQEWEQGPERESTALFCLGFFFNFFLLILNQAMLRGIDNEIQYFSSKHKKKINRNWSNTTIDLNAKSNQKDFYKGQLSKTVQCERQGKGPSICHFQCAISI